MLVIILLIALILIAISAKNVSNSKTACNRPVISGLKKYMQSEYYKQTHNNYYTIKYNKGLLNEYEISKILNKSDGYKRFLFNCYVNKDSENKTEIDIIMLHETGIYVLESKNYSGWIFGSESDQYWTQTFSTGRHHSHKEYFFNPIIQNKVHIKCLKTFLNDSSLNFYSYIVFGDNCTFKNIKAANNNCTVLNNKNLLFNIKYKINTSEKTLTPDKIDSLYNILYPFTQLTEEEKTRHIQKIKETYSVYNESSTPKVCPRCGIL